MTTQYRRSPRAPEVFPQTTVKLRVENLPPGFTAVDIHDYFSQYGDIDYIKMEPPTAVLVYSPIPEQSDFMYQRHSFRKGTSEFGDVYLRHIANTNRPVPSPLDPHKQLPSSVSFAPSSITVGVPVGETEMIALKHLCYNPAWPQSILEMSIKQQDGNPELSIRFPVIHGRDVVAHKLQIRLAYISQVQLADGPNESKQVVFTFQHPPKFFSNTTGSYGPPRHTNATSVHAEQFNRSRTFARITDTDEDMKAREHHPLQLCRPHVVLDPGRWLTWALKLDSNSRNTVMYPLLADVLRAYNVKVVRRPHILRTAQGRNVWHHFNSDMHISPGSDDRNALQTLQMHANGFPVLSFEVRYRLEVVLSKGLIWERQITQDFLARLGDMDMHRAMDLLDNAVAADKRFSNPMDLFDIPELRAKRKRRVPKTCVMMHSATITPTTMYIQPTQVEVSNRIIRKYYDIADRFLRVRFSDELYWGPLMSQQEGRPDDEVYDRVKRVLNKGLQIAGRLYIFLACGNSQFREHGAYFFAETPSVKVNTIRQFMGYFSHIREIPKYISRIGQCFSTTRAVSSIGSQPQIVEIPDIQRNGFIFTDGVGKISTFLAHMISQELRLGVEAPSLFQFRMGGCKGVLATDTTLPGRTVCIRPSQKKFISDFNQLEIIRVSSFASAYLNRQIILVLVTLGVPEQVFVRKLRHQLIEINKALENNQVALSMLQQNVDFNQVTNAMSRMIAGGMRGDPFVDSMMHLWRAWAVKWLKEKANLFIPQGAFLLGCVDESATLRMDKGELPEIFVQVPDDDSGNYKVVEGTCILVRNPALHPGDIRVVKAVKCPALSHLKDVVVLPQLGERDLANMCAGGDLDGDDFLVMWDPDLIPFIQDVEPMDYSAPQPIRSYGPVTQSDIIRFFCDYMKNNSLGTIAVAHRAWADYFDASVMHEKCIKLAQLHSKAVDYPKTGVPAVMTPDLRVQEYPHWHGKKRRNYHSKKILGQLFDEVICVEFQPQYHRGFDQRILSAYHRLNMLPQDVYTRAIELKAEYDEDIRRIMAQYGVNTEFEVWSAFVLEHNRDIKDYKFAEELGGVMNALKLTYRDACLEALYLTCATPGTDTLLATNTPPTTAASSVIAAAVTPGTATRPMTATVMTQLEKNARLASLVAALYKITADQVFDYTGDTSWDKHQQSSPMISFPWIFQDELLALATMGESGNGEMDLGEAMTRNNMQAARARRGAGAFRFSQVQPDHVADPLAGVMRGVAAMDISGETTPSVGTGSASSERDLARTGSTTSVSSLEASREYDARHGVEEKPKGAVKAKGSIKTVITPVVGDGGKESEDEEEMDVNLTKGASAVDRLAALVGGDDSD